MAVSLDLGIKALAEAIAARINTLKANDGDLTTLTTSTKTSLVAAINELKTALNSASGSSINDASTSTSSTWSSSKVNNAITTALAALVNGAPGTLDQLNELAAALGNDANFATTVATNLANRVRLDAAQSLTAAQKLQANTNLGVGDVTRDFAADFTAALT